MDCSQTFESLIVNVDWGTHFCGCLFLFFMKRRLYKYKSAICVILILGLFIGSSIDSYAVTNASIKAKEAEVSNAKKEVNGLKSGLTDIKAVKAELEKSKADLDAYITRLDSELASIQDKIEEYSKLIDNKEKEIEQKKLELEEAEKTQADQYAAMKKRIKFMYERGDSLYFEVLFNANSLAETISKADYIEMLSAYDRNKLDEYARTTEYVSACKDSLEAEKEVLDAAKEAQEKEQKNVEDLLSEKEEQVEAVTGEIADKEQAIKEYEKSISVMNAEIAALEKAIADEIAALEEASKRQYNGGMFAWPCPSYSRISDDYGNRVHPTLGVEKFHNGIDLAAPGGSPILAAYDGDVVAAAYSSSMGNYVMISHGSGIYTIYMHASALYVSKGAEVSKGQKIAAVGTTGRSTGNHLHFSVRQNGNYVSPWNYLK